MRDRATTQAYLLDRTILVQHQFHRVNGFIPLCLPGRVGKLTLQATRVFLPQSGGAEVHRVTERAPGQPDLLRPAVCVQLDVKTRARRAVARVRCRVALTLSGCHTASPSL